MTHQEETAAFEAVAAILIEHGRPAGSHARRQAAPPGRAACHAPRADPVCRLVPQQHAANPTAAYRRQSHIFRCR
jgi:hypothetical protein